MGFFDYLYAMGFWQWVGTLLLTAIIFNGFHGLIRITINRGKNGD